MANLIKWGSSDFTAVELMTTVLNSLGADAVSSLGTEFDNRTNKWPLGDFELVLGSLTPTSGTVVSLFLASALDNTNYPDAKKESAQLWVGAFALDTATGAKRTVLKGIPLPPSKFKPFLHNFGGTAFNSSGNTLKLIAYGPEVQ